MSTRYSQGVAGIFFSTRPRLLSCRFTGSRWVILLNGFQTIVQQIHRESLGYSSQRVLDYCQVDSQGVAGLFSSTGSRRMSTRYSQGVAGIFFSTGSRLLSCRYTGSRWVILLNRFQTIVQQIFTGSCWLFFSTVSRLLSSRDSQGVVGFFFSTDSRLLSSRYSQGVAGLHFSTASRLLSSRFSGSRWVILLNGFQTNVHQIFTGSRWDFLLNGFQTVVLQIHRESLGYSSQRVLDYCPVDSQGVARLFFSTGSRLLSSRFTGSRWVILLNGFQNIVQQIHRESLGYSSQRVPDYCPVDSEGFARSFFSTGSRLMPSRYSQGVAGIFFSTGSRLLSSRFTGNRWVILLNGFQNIVQQIHRESLGYSSQRVPDYCPVDSEGFAGSFFSTGSRLLSSRFTGSRCVILLNGFQTNVQQIFTGSRGDFLLNGFQTIVQQIHRESLCHSSQRVLD